MRDIIQMACGDCKRRNYSTTKNKKKTTERLELSKYCRFCRKHTAHKEQKSFLRARVPGPGPGCLKANSSIGRAPVSKTGGWGFETLLACQC